MYTLLYFVIHSLIHSLIRSHLLTWPILVTLNSASCHLRLYRLRSEVLLLLLPTLHSATWQHQAVLPCLVSEHQLLLKFCDASLHPCHSESTPAILGDLSLCTHCGLALEGHHAQYIHQVTILWHIQKTLHIDDSAWHLKQCYYQSQARIAA